MSSLQMNGYKSLITKEQFAYPKNPSTIGALLKVVDEWKWAKVIKRADHYSLVLRLTEGLRCH